jgi:serralysin
MAAPTPVPSSGNREVDGLLTGHRWDDTSLSFSFPGGGLPYVTEQLGDLLSPAALARFLALSAIPLVGPTIALGAFGSVVTLSALAFSGFQQFNPAQRASARLALGQFEDVSTLTFTEGGESTFTHRTLRYAESGLAMPAFGIPPLPRVQTLLGNGALGDAWFDNDRSFDQPAPGNHAGYTILHETGHLLGLKHGHEPGLFGSRLPRFVANALTDVSGPTLPPDRDSHEFSVMTYRSSIGAPVVDDATTNETAGYPQSLMMLDIQAIQYMYGANFDTNAGDTTYRWDPSTGEMFVNGAGQGRPAANRVFLTVWDGGGTDTYDLSNYGAGVTIDLRPGEWTTTSVGQLADLDAGMRASGLARGNVANALLFNGDPRSLIENGIGGPGNDTLIGNAADNRLDGGDGDDSLSGGAGHDTLLGGAGLDALDGGEGFDFLDGGEGRDTLEGGPGFDIATYVDAPAGVVVDLPAGTGEDLLLNVEQVVGSGFDDEFRGVSYVGEDGVARGANFSGLGGNDRIFGSDEGEAIVSFSSPFRISFGLTGGLGDDRIEGRGGGDLISGDEGNDTLLGGTGSDTITAGPGSNALIGGEGDDFLIGGGGSDTLFGDDNFFLGPVASGSDRFSGAIGQDVIADFQSGADILTVVNSVLLGARLFQALDTDGNGTLGAGDEFVRIVSVRLDDPESGNNAERLSTVVDFGAAIARAAGTEAAYAVGSNAVTFFGATTLVAGDISGGVLIA